MIRHRLLLGAIAVGLTAIVASALTHSALSGATDSSANQFVGGTVILGDNAAGGALLELGSAMPGDTDTGCVNVAYTGSLDAEVRLYANVTGPLAPYLTLTVARGTDPSPAFDDCSSFSPDPTDYIGAGAGVLFTGVLSDYPVGYESGIADPSLPWTTSEQHVYQLSISLNDDSAAEGLSATADLRWEARNL